MKQGVKDVLDLLSTENERAENKIKELKEQMILEKSLSVRDALMSQLIMYMQSVATIEQLRASTLCEIPEDFRKEGKDGERLEVRLR
jgi:hypothetical protein